MAYTKTLLNYRYAVKRRLSIELTDDNNEWGDDLLDDCINEARQVFWNRGQYHNRRGVSYVDAVNNQEEYSVPSMDTILAIRYNRAGSGTEKHVLRYVSLEQFLAMTPTSESGECLYWTRRGNKFLVYPRPDANGTSAFEVYGEQSITDLSDDDDVDSNVENRYFWHVVEYAIGAAWDKAEQEQKANAHYAKFEKMMDDSMYEILSNQTGQNIDTEQIPGWIDELDERRYGQLTSS